MPVLEQSPAGSTLRSRHPRCASSLCRTGASHVAESGADASEEGTLASRTVVEAVEHATTAPETISADPKGANHLEGRSASIRMS
jgi:hypothetical protein